MAANDILYKFITPSKKDHTNDKGGATELIGSIVQDSQHSTHMAKVPVPLGKTADINIVKDFRWTKSALKENHTTPTITLREMQVVSPAFFHNMTTILNQVVGEEGILPRASKALHSLVGQTTGTQATLVNNVEATANFQPGVAALAQFDGPKPNLLTDIVTSDPFINSVEFLTENLTTGKAAFDKFKSGVLGNTRWNWSNYLKDYESMYGVKKTNFMYRVPYLEDNYKQISTSWGNDSGGIVTQTISKISDILKLTSPAVGVDIAKTYNYPDAGPSHDVNFFLDNTVMDGVSHAQKNYRFIYLLLYQNLPNRITRSQITPPVIYQSSLPGVFSYRWSYLSKLVVNFIGARRPMKIQITPELKGVDVIMPEGFEVQLTITSLVPETKNLMYDSIDNPVTSDVHLPSWLERATPGGPKTPSAEQVLRQRDITYPPAKEERIDGEDYVTFGGFDK